MDDFGLLVARYNTSTPAYTADNDLREMRIDSGGRLYTRLADDRDEAIRYFYDGESVDGTVANDRGVLILGKNDTDSNYQALKVNDDGSLAVGFQVGTDVSEHSDNAGTGEVALVVGSWVKIHEIAIAAGTLRIDGFSYASDKNTLFQMVMLDGVAGDHTDLDEILDSQITTSSRPSDHVSYTRTLDKAGGTNVRVGIYAKQLQQGTAGVGLAMINAHTTS